MSTPFFVCLAWLLCLLPTQRVLAHAGELDPSFGQGGIAYFPLSENGSCLAGANAVAVHPNGSIWIAGWSRDATIPARDAAWLKVDPSGHVVADDFGYEQTELRAIAVNAANGEVYVAGNQGNVVSVRALNTDGSFDTGFGVGGARGIAINGDTGHQTTVNDLQLDAGGSLYLTGGYNGSGTQQIMLAYLTIDGTLQSAEAMPNNAADFIATSIGIQPPDGHLLVSGYTLGSCATEDFDVTFASGFHFTPDAGYASPLYGFAGTAGCFVDASAVLNDNGSLIEAGRVLNNDGTWFAMWQKVAANGALIQQGFPFNMSPWGDNSPRKVLLLPNGPFIDNKWVIAGFTGVDASGNPGAWAGRFKSNGDLDSDFGNGGSTLINFDPSGHASGQALGAALDRYGRVILVGTHYTGTSDANGNDCSEIFAARLQSDDLIFINGFDR